MLWFKFILGLKFFKLVSILFAIVPDYGNEYTTKENKNWTSFKNFPPKLNLNHNIDKWHQIYGVLKFGIKQADKGEICSMKER